MVTSKQTGSWDEVWRKQKPPWVYHNVLETVLGEVENPAASKILEVGCGRGFTLLQLACCGAQVVGLDYSAEAIAVCQRLRDQMENPEKSTFVLGDARALPFADQSFNFAYSIGVIEHFEDPRPLLMEQYRVLRTGGKLLVQVPQKYSLGTLVKKLMIPLGKWPYGGWETEFSAQELTNLAVQTGFEPQICFGYGSFILASLRHFLVPTLGFGGMWRVGLNTAWVRAVKAHTAMDVCLVAKKHGLPNASRQFDQRASLSKDSPCGFSP